MTSAPTKAILAAAIGRSYTIPFSGELPFLYVREVAGAFLAAVAEDREGARILDLNGRTATTARFRDLVLEEFPGADIELGAAPFPFPGQPVGCTGAGAARRLRRDGAGRRRARDGSNVPSPDEGGAGGPAPAQSVTSATQ